MDTGRACAVDSSLGSQPYVNTAVSNTLVPVAGVRPQGQARTPREIYTAVIYNPSAADAYVQVLAPTVSGNLTGQASLGSPGAQSGVIATLPPDSAAITNGSSYWIDLDGQAELAAVTVTAGPTLQSDGSSQYTLSFTTTKAHATSGPIAIMGGVTLGTTAPKQSYGLPTKGTLPLLFGDMGQQYPLGLLIAATTTAAGSSAPATPLVVNLGIA